MNKISERPFSWLIILFILTLTGCVNKIERGGVVVDDLTNQPVPGVSIDIYLKYQRGDSLSQKVFTNDDGYFFIYEKRGKGLLFELNKDGYISHVNSLSVMNDTIRLEPTTN